MLVNKQNSRTLDGSFQYMNQETDLILFTNIEICTKRMSSGFVAFAYHSDNVTDELVQSFMFLLAEEHGWGFITKLPWFPIGEGETIKEAIADLEKRTTGIVFQDGIASLLSWMNQIKEIMDAMKDLDQYNLSASMVKDSLSAASKSNIDFPFNLQD